MFLSSYSSEIFDFCMCGLMLCFATHFISILVYIAPNDRIMYYLDMFCILKIQFQKHCVKTISAVSYCTRVGF